MTQDEIDARARTRFFTIGLVRLGGALMVMFGIVIASGKLAGVPVAAGYAIVVLGFLDLALFPRLLAKAWRSPPDA